MSTDADTEFHDLAGERLRLRLIRCWEAAILLDEEGLISDED
jgi:hypothetical protein